MVSQSYRYIVCIIEETPVTLLIRMQGWREGRPHTGRPFSSDSSSNPAPLRIRPGISPNSRARTGRARADVCRRPGMTAGEDRCRARRRRRCSRRCRSAAARRQRHGVTTHMTHRRALLRLPYVVADSPRVASYTGCEGEPTVPMADVALCRSRAAAMGVDRNARTVR